MASRSRRIFELAIKGNAEHEQMDTGNEPNIPSNLPNHIRVEEIDNDLGTFNRRERHSSTSSTSSSSNSSSSSSTSFYEDSDDSVKDPNYVAFNITENEDHESDNHTENETSTRTQHESGNNTENEANTSTQHKSTQKDDTPTKMGKKRPRQENKWKKNIAKRLRNCGKSYESPKTKKTVLERKMKPPCKETCRFKCQSYITEDQRQQLLQEYWSLGEIEKQWTFLANAIQLVVPLHRYVKVDSHGNVAPKRENNNAFYLTVSGVKIRVCKTFFKNTLAINNRPIETAIKKKNKNTNISTMKDERGCHGKHVRLDENITNGVKAFIEAIPKIESHYIRANSKRHYIDGSKTISDLHRDYVEKCKTENVPFTSYVTFYRIFTQGFNISFFVPKKDLCDICEAFKNSTEEEKASEKNTYENHIKEKQLSRIEKEKDKNNKDIFVAVYDLQAVFQCPKGDISVFYYKSKLNVLNLTIYNIRTNEVESYVWDESNANRGINEIGTCVFNYLKAISETAEDLDVVFYSDNCAGQQKNKFMISLYLYAVQNLPNLRSVTHKFLIKGHTQNEGDSAHSQIEREVKRQLRSGPMYTPDAFIGAIKAARKKGTPIHVNEMCYEDFIDWKSVCSQMNFALLKDEMGDNVKLTEIKVIRVQKDEPCAIWFKNSYAEEHLKKAVVVKKKRSKTVELKKAYIQKPGLAEKKKSDLMDLINKKLIPRYHRPFFEAL